MIFLLHRPEMDGDLSRQMSGERGEDGKGITAPRSMAGLGAKREVLVVLKMRMMAAMKVLAFRSDDNFERLLSLRARMEVPAPGLRTWLEVETQRVDAERDNSATLKTEKYLRNYIIHYLSCRAQVANNYQTNAIQRSVSIYAGTYKNVA